MFPFQYTLVAVEYFLKFGTKWVKFNTADGMT